MKLFVVLCLAAVAVAGPAQQRINYSPDNAQILKYENENFGHYYRYVVEQSDGTRQEQQGELRNEGTDEESLAVKGIFSWVGPDDVTYTVNYIADDKGYQPEIEQGPGGGIPPAVVASLLG